MVTALDGYSPPSNDSSWGESPVDGQPTPTQGRRPRGLTVAAAVVVVLTLAAGCGGDDDRAADQTLPKVKPRPTTTTTSSTPTSTTEDPDAKDEAEIRAAYEKWREGVRELFVDPDPSDPRLDVLYADGPLKDGVRENLTSKQQQGRTAILETDTVSRWQIGTLAMMSPTEAVIEDCYVDGAISISITTNEVLDDAVVAYENRIRFVREDSTWKAIEGEVLRRTPGEVECEAES